MDKAGTPTGVPACFLEGIRVLGSLEGFSNKIVYLCITLDLQRQTETEIEMVNLQNEVTKRV